MTQARAPRAAELKSAAEGSPHSQLGFSPPTTRPPSSASKSSKIPPAGKGRLVTGRVAESFSGSTSPASTAVAVSEVARGPPKTTSLDSR